MAIIPTVVPIPGLPQPPIFPLRYNANGGGYLFVRHNPNEGGGCTKFTGYPCTHPGLDCSASAGTPVHAPESGTVVATADGTSSPFGGYGPWVIVIQGASGRFHLLAHLNPATAGNAPLGSKVTAGQVVGTVAYDHTHWEVRKKAIPDFAAGETNMGNITDPLQWLREQAGLGSVGGLIIIGAAATLAYLLWRR